MRDKQAEVLNIIDSAVDQLVTVGLERPEALKMLAFQSVLRLSMSADDAVLLELRKLLLAEIDIRFTPASDETLQ